MNVESFANPKRLCDLVMKGGVTSGVVYPLAVCELAKQYTFKNIGGTSAGAIAAAAAAAAEYARRHRKPAPAGFVTLATLPDFLAQPRQLLSLFTPDSSVRPLFDLATAAMTGRTAPTIIAALARQLLRTFWPIAVLVAIAAIGIYFWLLADLPGPARTYSLVATLFVAVALFVVTAGILLYRLITRAVPANFYGLTKGFAPDAPLEANAPLTNWLTRYLNELAGKPLSEGLLTFGDLYDAPRIPADPPLLGGPARAITLEMMTTALNHGRPYRLPFQDPDAVFYFSRRQFSLLFPSQVVQHLVDHPRLTDDPLPIASDGEELSRFPDARNLPVVVATRMSLSFPLLLSAIPLYAVDFSLKENQDHNERRKAERCWFSDGGISSNLPIHFFDAPLPRWPTFGINLKEFHPDHLSEEGAVFLTSRANSSTPVFWNRFETSDDLISSFLFAIINSMQNWRDNAQSRVPGYRDRLVHISQGKEEGGLNLNMLPDTIQKLSKRGQRAGVMLVERFGETRQGQSPGWPEHRVTRFRSSMALTIEWLHRMARGYGNPVLPDLTYEQLLMRGPHEPPPIYRIDPAHQAGAKAVVDEVIGMTERWKTDGSGTLEDGPKPTPELRIVPRI